MEKEKFRKYIEESTEKVMQQNADIVPQIFLCLSNGRLALIVMPMPDGMDKDKVVDALRELVEQHEVELYYSAMTGWMVNAEKMKELAKEKFKQMHEGKLSPSEFTEFLKGLQNSPAGNSTREEVLILGEFDKHEGMQMKLLRINRKDGDEKSKIFTLEQIHDWSEGTQDMYSRFNVWTPHQVTFGDEK
jgi:hypothetical protein